MTQEDKKLLLIDLCGRVPYGVICDCLHDYHTKVSAVDAEDLTVYYPYCDEWESIEYCKPYLRSMSSMTEEERKEYNEYLFHGASIGLISNTATAYELIDWLNRNHFDYRGLIEMGLAIAVTKENNPYEN